MKITYIYHSCFAVEFHDKVLLFDPAGRGFFPGGIWSMIEGLVSGKELYVFISHGHRDHYTSRIFELEAKKAYHILSEDIGPKDEAVVLSDGESKKIGDLRVRTFKSNDEGLAYLISIQGVTIYFGGDLAKWDWPEWSRAKRQRHVKVFERTLDILKDLNIDVAFSNMDQRLESWAGPVEFINTVKPRFFVPIHTFGNEEWIDDLLMKDLPDETTVFKYERPGEFVIWSM